MRRNHQKQLLEIIKTLREANILIEKLVDKGNYDAALNLIIDCHESAVNVGNSIEELSGGDNITVTYLEKYCDMLYNAGVSAKEGILFRKELALLHNQLLTIEESISNDLKIDKIEVAFFPYKASMWDSMESVWLAANDDPMCDVYVVPIPYYDLSNGNTVQMHYEGDLYPEYVPVIDWKEYNVEARHPDIIYIHNPYDDSNLVTRVHPDYYSKRLREFTDMLVYIPYFVVLDDVPQEFCVLPGTVYSDIVIVQSEKVKETYIKSFEEFEKKNNCIGQLGDYRNKFQVFGSPKFDKVIKTKREDFRLPGSWENLIQKEDGKRKKVVLYNTGIRALLSGNENYIKKLSSNLNRFKNRKDIVLLWRPHPLNMATYASMRPQLLQEYMHIVENYVKEGWGIYDDTADLNRAIAVSDAYYGDWSSLVALYNRTGKPIMIQGQNTV